MAFKSWEDKQAYCIDLHHFLRAEGNMVKTPVGLLHVAAMDQWL